jgi:hypothetical protein
MKRVLSAAALAVLCTVGTAVAVATPGTAAAATATLATPSDVTVTPGVGAVTVSWGEVGSGDVLYSVTSSPAGASCTVVAQSSCTIPDTSVTPYSFTVAATEPNTNPSAPSHPTPPLAPHLVLVVAGQSNANGYESYAVDPVTGIDYMAPPYTNGADSHDLITWLPWSVLQGDGATPVPLDTPQQIGSPTDAVTVFGPEIGLARQLWADTGTAVTIVKAADPGTSLAVNWNPTKSGAFPDGLFRDTVSAVKNVMADDGAAGQFDVLGGFYWYQGESDVTNRSWASRYQTRLALFITDLRADLPMSPKAPVALAEEDLSGYIAYLDSTGALSKAVDARYLAGNAEVRAADVWAADNLPDVVDVDTLDLARVPPIYIHLSNVSQLTLGEELAKASEKLLP